MSDANTVSFGEGQMAAKYDDLGVRELKALVVAAIGQSAFEKKRLLEKAEFVAVLRDRDEAAANKALGVSVLKPGKYVIGDPCFLACDLDDLERFTKTYYDNESDDDDDDDNMKEPQFNSDTPVIAFNTADPAPSSYTDRSGTHTITVNTSAIAIVDLAYNNNYSKTDAVMVEFDEPTRCYAEKGLIHFGHVVFHAGRRGAAKRAAPRAAAKREEEEEVEASEVEASEDEESEFVDSEEEERQEFERWKRKKERKRRRRAEEDDGGSGTE